jgi:hypothetical protein
MNALCLLDHLFPKERRDVHKGEVIQEKISERSDMAVTRFWSLEVSGDGAEVRALIPEI